MELSFGDGWCRKEWFQGSNFFVNNGRLGYKDIQFMKFYGICKNDKVVEWTRISNHLGGTYSVEELKQRRRQLRDLARIIGYKMSINNCDWECTKNAKDWTTFIHDIPSDLSKQLYDEGKDRAFFARLQIFCDPANKQGYIFP